MLTIRLQNLQMSNNRRRNGYHYGLFLFNIWIQEKEFLKMFQMPVIEVPTNMANIRKDLPIQAFAVSIVVVISFLLF